MNLNITLNKIYAYIIAFLLLLDGSSMWLLTGVIPLSLNSIRLILFFVCLLAIVSIGRINISYRFVGIVIITLIWFLFFGIISHYHVPYYIRNLVLVYLVFFLYVYTMMKSGKLKDLAYAYMTIFFIIAGFTTFMWLFASIIRIIPLSSTTYTWLEHTLSTSTFHNLYFENSAQNTSIFGKTIARNTGIYAEAPGFSSYFLYAFGIEMSFFKQYKGHKVRMMFLLLTSLTTLSTKLILFLVIILVVDYLLSFQKKRSVFFVIFRWVLSITVLVIGGYIFYSVLIDKMSTGSFTIRLDDVRASLKVWKGSPIFGSGLGNTTPIINNFTVARNNNGLSMGLLLILAQGGIWLTSFYIIPFIITIFREEDKVMKKNIFILALAVLINLFVSNVILAPSFLMFLAIGYAYLSMTQTEHSELLQKFLRSQNEST